MRRHNEDDVDPEDSPCDSGSVLVTVRFFGPSFDTRSGQNQPNIGASANMPQKPHMPSVTDHDPKMEKWLDDLEEVRRVTSRTPEPKLRPASKGVAHKGKTGTMDNRKRPAERV